jgi:hypothetical protein
MPAKSIGYYITAHGYGHGVRSCDIIREIQRLRPNQHIVIVTKLPEDFLHSRIAPGSFTLRSRAYDVGMVQLDSIRVDVAASMKQAGEICRHRTRLLGEESEFLKRSNIGLVVADIPSIPLEAANYAGIPAVAVGNFSWDWIYSAYQDGDSGWQHIAQTFAEGYARADLLLRLPFHCEMAAFRNVEDIPLVASPGSVRREEIAAACGARPELPWILLSFSSLDWDDQALDRVESISDHEFFTVLPLQWRRRNIRTLDRAVFPFSDILASCDAVISKPGYGILSDCLANGKPMIFAERTDFAEYPVLEAATRRYLRHVHIPARRLYKGELRETLRAIREAPEAVERLRLGGGRIAAHRLLSFL